MVQWLRVGAPWLLVVAGVLVTLLFRYPGLDQAYLLLAAWEFVSGKRFYVDIYALPPSAFLHSFPIVLHNWTGWPVVSCWDIFMAILCILSGILYATFVSGPRFRWLALIWLAALLLAFDDYVMGGREFLFAIFWIPYLAARLRCNERTPRFLQVLVGLLVGFIISVKPHFALYVLFLDLPLFVVLRRETAFLPFGAMVFSGLSQVVIFFVMCDFSRFVAVTKQFSYYEVVGFDYGGTIKYIFHSVSPFLFVAFALLFWPYRAPWRRSMVMISLCLGTALIALGSMILQGQPRPIYLTPMAISLIAGGNILVEDILSGANAIEKRGRRIARLAIVLCLLVPVVYAFTFNGLLIGAAKKYLAGNDQVETVGRPEHDVFYDWVRSHISPNERIFVIALQPGYPALDPVLSLIRLNRRAFSRVPVLDFPLRAAIISGDSQRIDLAVHDLISDFNSSGSHWLIIRRGGPGPPLVDVVAALEGIPKFIAWLHEHFRPFASFGEYEVYRLQDDRTG